MDGFIELREMDRIFAGTTNDWGDTLISSKNESTNSTELMKFHDAFSHR